MEAKNLSSDHTFILRLLDHGALDAGTLMRASLGSKSQVNRILDELMQLDLIERQWDGNGFIYRKR
jgi:predicted transcriptional regulator